MVDYLDDPLLLDALMNEKYDAISSKQTKPRTDQLFVVDAGPPASFYLEKTWHWHYRLHVPRQVLDGYPHIFIHTPKVGGTSLIYQPHVFSLGHMYARHYPSRYHSKLFTIVRNPYSRLVSAYLFMKRGGFRKNRGYQQLISTYPTFTSWVLHGLSEEDLTFRPTSVVSELTVPQYKFICDAPEMGKRRLLVPEYQILRFENYATEVERFLGIPSARQYKYNVSQPYAWKTFYRQKCIQDKVYRLYQTDFFLFDYDYRI